MEQTKETEQDVRERVERAYSMVVYAKFASAIEEIEKAFFTGKGKNKLPRFVFAINNKCKSAVAFVSPNALFDKADGKKVQYLGINPRYLDRGSAYVLKTLCHELCHVYEHAYIHIPRGGYHDKQWHDLMISCGLEPVYMNKSKTRVSDKIIEGGEFEDFVKAFEEKNPDFFNVVEFRESVVKNWKENNPDSEADEDGAMADNADKLVKTYNRNKIKYVCPSCNAKVWGKAGLHVTCSDCGEDFEEEEK